MNKVENAIMYVYCTFSRINLSLLDRLIIILKLNNTDNECYYEQSRKCKEFTVMFIAVSYQLSCIKETVN